MKFKNIFSFAWLLPIIFLLLTILLRLPFMSQWLYHMDSVIYALGMEKFDFIQGTPPAPGYIAYIYLGKILCYFIRDANKSLVLIGILFSGLSCGMLYLLGKEMFGKRNGFISALLLLTSPLVWFFGEIALSAISGLFFSTLVAFFSYRAAMVHRGKLSPAILSAVFLGIGSSFRQDLLIFLFPLWLFSIRKRPFKQILLGLSILFISSLIWIVPSSVLAKGLMPYLTLCRERMFGSAGHFSYMTTANIFLKKAHIYNYFRALLLSAFLGIVPLIFYLGKFFKPRTVIRDKKIQFLIMWILPSFIYINLVGGGPGYCFVHLSALFMCISMVIESIYYGFNKAGFMRLGKSILAITIILIIGVNVFFFLYYDPNPGKQWMGNSWFRYSDIQKHDGMLGIKLNYIKERFFSEDSIIFTGLSKQAYWPVLYYLSSYKVYQPGAVYWKGSFMKMAHHHRRSPIAGPLFTIPEGIKNIIFFDEDIYPYVKSFKPIEKILLDKGYILYFFHVTDEKNIKLDFHNLEIF